MNALRRAENRAPLTSNELLNEATQILMDDVVQRNLLDRGDTLSLSDGTNISQLLEQLGYQSYNGFYEVNVVSLILRIPPADAINYWNQNNDTEAGLESQQMLQNIIGDLPIFFDRFREVGIAYQFNEENERHYYVLVFASQPDVFPVSITEIESNDVITSTESERVLVHVPNYVIARNLNAYILRDEIEFVRISEESTALSCPTNASQSAEWETYRKNYEYTLSPPQGEKIIYVQLCDANGNTVTETVEILFGSVDNRPSTSDNVVGDPRVLTAVAETQSAVATATSDAEIMPTVEFILTATAQAPDSP
ncbi:MAG: hypothetical protein AAFV93_25390 [Chloroflexota bacterium]